MTPILVRIDPDELKRAVPGSFDEGYHAERYRRPTENPECPYPQFSLRAAAWTLGYAASADRRRTCNSTPRP